VNSVLAALWTDSDTTPSDSLARGGDATLDSLWSTVSSPGTPLCNLFQDFRLIPKSPVATMGNEVIWH
jgi:hypothetical protein